MARRELPLLVSQKEEIDRLYREGLEASEIARDSWPGGLITSFGGWMQWWS